MTKIDPNAALRELRALVATYLEGSDDAPRAAELLAAVAQAEDRRHEALRVFIAGYLHGRSSVGDHEPAGREAEAAFYKWWAECGSREVPT